MNPCCTSNSFSVRFPYTFSNSNYSYQQVNTIKSCNSVDLCLWGVGVPVYPHRCAVITVILLGIIEDAEFWCLLHQLSFGLSICCIKVILVFTCTFPLWKYLCESCFRLLIRVLPLRRFLRKTLCLWPLLMNSPSIKHMCACVAQASHIENVAVNGGLAIGWPGRGGRGLNAAVFLPHSLSLILPLLPRFAKQDSFFSI